MAQEPIRRTILQQKDLQGVPGREAIQYVADIAPGALVGKHTHPGPEFGYVVEGTLVLEQVGQPPVTVNAGDSFHNPGQTSPLGQERLDEQAGQGLVHGDRCEGAAARHAGEGLSACPLGFLLRDGENAPVPKVAVADFS